MGSGPLRREKRPQEGGDAPHDTAVLAMTAKRLAWPASQGAGDDHGRADDVYGPEAKAWALAHRYRARDVRRRQIAALEPARFCRTAARFHADVDRLVWETPTRYCASDAEDDDGAPWPTPDIPALRQRGHPQAGRAGHPQVVVGLALTRDGLPGRSWVCPGPTAEVSTSDDLKADVRGWRLHRCVWVGASGMVAAAHRQRLSRAWGRYILAVPLRQVTEGPLAVLTRAGRYRHVAHHRRVKAVDVGAGERRRRDGGCHNPDEAAREQAHRAPLLALVRAELAALDGRQADHPQNACALMAARRFGRDLRLEAGGRLRLDRTQVAAEATEDGPCVVTTHDDTLDAEEVALGDTRLMWSEGCFRRMKTTGLHTRPLSHGRPHRIIAHVTLGGLALRRPRAAEIRCQQPWRTIRQTRDP